MVDPDTATKPRGPTPLMSGNVRQVAVPPAARALSTLSRVGYEDAFLVDTGLDQDRSGEQWSRVILEGAPVFLRRRLRWGWFALGLRLGCTPTDRFVLGWEVRRSTPDFALLGAGGRLGLSGEHGPHRAVGVRDCSSGPSRRRCSSPPSCDGRPRSHEQPGPLSRPGIDRSCATSSSAPPALRTAPLPTINRPTAIEPLGQGHSAQHEFSADGFGAALQQRLGPNVVDWPRSHRRDLRALAEVPDYFRRRRDLVGHTFQLKYES